MHIEYIAQFCEIIFVFARLQLATYVRVVETTTNTYYVLPLLQKRVFERVKNSCEKVFARV